MNITYVVKKGTGTIERKTWFATWNISKIFKFRTKIMGWERSQPVAGFATLFGKRYGINGSHIIEIQWFRQPNNKFEFSANVKLRNGSINKILGSFVERDELEFSIEDWDTHFIVRAKNIISGVEYSQTFDKDGENTWWWTGGTVVEPKWLSNEKPLSDFNIIIQTI